MSTGYGSNHFTDSYLEDIHVSEKEKSSEWYLKDNIDYWIANLVRERPHIKTFRDYYQGKRRNRDFDYLTENFGIGTPSQLNFTNLIKPRIDALLSQVEGETFDYKVSCVDDKTIDVIQEQKKIKKLNEVRSTYENFARSAASAFQEGKEVPPTELATTLKKVLSKYGDNYLSDFEIAAQNVLEYVSEVPSMDLRQKFKQMAQDFLITGECHYRVYPDRLGADPTLQVIKPENIFFNKNTNSQYLDTVDAVVHREYYTRKEIMAKYGKYMNKEQKEWLFGDNRRTRTARSLRSGADLELYYNEDNSFFGQKSYTHLDVIEVLHVEWIALNEVSLTEEDQDNETQVEKGYQNKVKKKAYRMDRYEGTRIAGSIYLNAGKSAHVTRSESRPYECSLSYDGIFYNDRHGKPFSIVGAMKDLQDVYDLTLFHRDNLIANSGVAGDRINIAGIPKVLGNNFMERLMKFIALKKNGFELIDPTEPGAQLFNHYGSFDNSVNGNSLQAIGAVLQMMEKQADLLAGVNQQMLGQIAERDAVGNVRQGIRQSLMINRDLFDLLRTSHKRVLTSILNAAKISYKKGKKISYVAGSESYVFDIVPDKFCYSDYAIYITYSMRDMEKLETLKVLAKEYASNGMLDPDVLTHIVLSDSITEVSRLVNNAWKVKKIENDQLQQATQQVEQMQQQMKQMETQLKQAQTAASKADEFEQQFKLKELALREKEVYGKLGIDREQLGVDKTFNRQQIELKEEVVKLEREQLYLDTGNAREPKNL